MKSFLMSSCAAAALVTAAFSPALALNDQGIPDTITYVTGGIGDEERSALEATKGNYNLWIMSAATSGEFEGDTHVVIRDQKGQELINAEAGPLFYAKLPPGRYTVEGSNAGQNRSQNVNVSAGKTSNVHFSWK